MRRFFSFFLSALLLLSGCTAAPVEEPDAAWDAYQQGQAETSPEPEPSELPPAFSMVYHSGHTLDPVTCGEGIQQDVASLLFEPLFQLDDNFEPLPLLCESYTWDDTGLVCTLVIRQNVTFSDGTVLTAGDVADTLRRAATAPRYSYRLRQVVSITASNRENTVTITLTTPNRGFPALLDIPVVKSGTEGQTVPVGTGPYVYVTASEGDRLLKNTDWWQNKTLPVDAIDLVHAKDRDTAMYLFSTRRVSLVTADPTVDLATGGQRSTSHRPTMVLQFIGFNTRSGVFADPAARAAFSRGLQREKLVDAFLSGHAEAAFFPISPRSPLYPADLAVPYAYEDTLSAFQQAELGSGETRELKLLVNQENSFRLTNAQFIAETLSLLDLHVTVSALPWEEYLAALEAGDFDLYYGEARLTADWDLTDLLGSAGTMNYGGYASPTMDDALLTFANAENRQSAARLLCALMLNDAPIAPICFRSDTVLTHPGVVEGISPAPGSTFAHLENWSIHLAK